MKILLVINPVSGGKNKDSFLNEAKELCEKYGHRLKVFKTTGKSDIDKVKELAKDFDPDRVAAAGGDGTFLMISVALLNTSIPIGIIPMGSANGMAGELNVNADPTEAFHDFLISGLIMDMDLLEINKEHYCLHVGDVGVNANIVKSYEEDANRGMMTYAKYFVEELKSMEKFKSTLIIEDERKELNSLMLAICNARKYGTGVLLNKTGSPFDGKFELVAFKEINAKALIKAGLSVFNEEFYDSQVSEVIQVEKARVEFEEERLLQLDGEVIGKVDALDVEIKKAAIKYISTNLNPYV